VPVYNMTLFSHSWCVAVYHECAMCCV